MLGCGQHNLGLCGDRWPQVESLQSQGGADKQTEIRSVYMSKILIILFFSFKDRNILIC